MEKELLEDILTAQVLLLAAQLKANKAASGTHTSGNCIDEALKMMTHEKSHILQTLHVVP